MKTKTLILGAVATYIVIKALPDSIKVNIPGFGGPQGGVGGAGGGAFPSGGTENIINSLVSGIVKMAEATKTVVTEATEAVVTGVVDSPVGGMPTDLAERVQTVIQEALDKVAIPEIVIPEILPDALDILNPKNIIASAGAAIAKQVPPWVYTAAVVGGAGLATVGVVKVARGVGVAKLAKTAATVAKTSAAKAAAKTATIIASRTASKVAAKITAKAASKTATRTVSKVVATTAARAGLKTAVRGGARLGLRAIPVVGTALMVVDAIVTGAELITGRDIAGSWIGFGPEIRGVVEFIQGKRPDVVPMSEALTTRTQDILSGMMRDFKTGRWVELPTTAQLAKTTPEQAGRGAFDPMVARGFSGEGITSFRGGEMVIETWKNGKIIMTDYPDRGRKEFGPQKPPEFLWEPFEDR